MEGPPEGSSNDPNKDSKRSEENFIMFFKASIVISSLTMLFFIYKWGIPGSTPWGVSLHEYIIMLFNIICIVYIRPIDTY